MACRLHKQYTEEAGPALTDPAIEVMRSLVSLVPPVAFLAASASLRFTPTIAATASRWAALAVALVTVHRTVRCRLKRKLVDRHPTVSALQIEVSHVDHPTFSRTHSVSFFRAQPVKQRLPKARPV